MKLLPCGPIGPKLMVLLLPLIALHNLLLVLDVLYILLNKTRILTLNSPLLFSFSLFLYILVPLDPLTLRPCSLLLLLPSSFLFLEEQRLEWTIWLCCSRLLIQMRCTDLNLGGYLSILAPIVIGPCKFNLLEFWLENRIKSIILSLWLFLMRLLLSTDDLMLIRAYVLYLPLLYPEVVWLEPHNRLSLHFVFISDILNRRNYLLLPLHNFSNLLLPKWLMNRFLLFFELVKV